MLPKVNRTGSVKMMSIGTGKLVIRDQFTILPMPSSVFDKLNEMAAAEGGKIVVRSNMVYIPQRGLRKADDLTYIHSTDVFPVEPAITANSGAAKENFEVPQYVSPNHYNLADDVVADIEIPAIEATYQSYFDIPDLDVGPLIEFEP